MKPIVAVDPDKLREISNGYHACMIMLEGANDPGIAAKILLREMISEIETDPDRCFSYSARVTAAFNFCVKNKERLRFLKLIIKKSNHDLVACLIFDIASSIRLDKKNEITWEAFEKAFKARRNSETSKDMN